jgi:hypothetical protein
MTRPLPLYAVLVFLSIPLSLGAAEKTIGPGDDIASAVQGLSTGDTLTLKAGTYPGFDLGNKDGVTIKAAPGEHAVIDGALGVGSNIGIITAGSLSNVTLGSPEGTLEITDSAPWVAAMQALNLDDATDLATFQSDYLSRDQIDLMGIQCTSNTGAKNTFQHLTIHHVPAICINQCSFDGSQYLNNTLHHCGVTRSGYAFYGHGSGQTYSGNVIHDMPIGFHLYAGTTQDAVIEHNILYNLGATAWWHRSSAAVKHGGAGILIDPGVNNTLRYNTLWSVDSPMAVGGDTRSENNILFQTTGDTGPSGSNNFTSDPQFVNASGGDFHLQAGSPAKTAASDGGEVGAYGGGATCIGADCGGSGTTPPPTSQAPAPHNLRLLHGLTTTR